MSNTLGNVEVNDPNNLDEVFAAMRDEMLSGEEYPLQPLNAPKSSQSDQEVTNVQHEADSTNDAQGFDFTKIDNPGTPPNDVRELPIWGLPVSLQGVVEDVTQGYQCHRDFVVASMFVAAATMLGKRVSCQFGNHTNFPGLWVAIVGNTASGKTAPLSFFFKPIELMEREAFETYRQEMKQWNKQDAVDRDEKPVYHHILINNSTDESVLHELSVNETVCWKVDELRTMFDGFGKYSKGGNGTIVGNLLSIFNNIDVSITRVSNEPKYLVEPNLNIIGGTQPSILKRVMGYNGFVSDGLFQRFLFVYPDDIDTPKYEDVRISTDVRNIWLDTIKMLSMAIGELNETSDARQLHIDAINRWRNLCNHQYREFEAMISLLRKLEIHLCRWSIVAAVLSGSNTINADVLRYSVECMDYFRLCGEKAFCLVANGDHPKELSTADILRSLHERYPDLNQSKLADAIGTSQPYISKVLKQ